MLQCDVMGVLTSDLFIQLTTTLAHLSNMTINSANGIGGVVSNETLQGRKSSVKLTPSSDPACCKSAQHVLLTFMKHTFSRISDFPCKRCY